MASSSDNRPAGNYPIPFDPEGNLLPFPTPKYKLDKNNRMSVDANSIIWRPNYRFKDSLQFKSALEGKSAYKFLFDNTKGICYTMFMKDFVELCKHSLFDHGKVESEFEFVKRGSHYGIKLSHPGQTSVSVRETLPDNRYEEENFPGAD